MAALTLAQSRDADQPHRVGHRVLAAHRGRGRHHCCHPCHAYVLGPRQREERESARQGPQVECQRQRRRNRVQVGDRSASCHVTARSSDDDDDEAPSLDPEDERVYRQAIAAPARAFTKHMSPLQFELQGKARCIKKADLGYVVADAHSAGARRAQALHAAAPVGAGPPAQQVRVHPGLADARASCADTSQFIAGQRDISESRLYQQVTATPVQQLKTPVSSPLPRLVHCSCQSAHVMPAQTPVVPSATPQQRTPVISASNHVCNKTYPRQAHTRRRQCARSNLRPRCLRSRPQSARSAARRQLAHGKQ